jgi:aspartyl protease family protein
LLDTGATFVSLKRAFADKASVDIESETVIKLHTANGIGEGKRGRVKSIRLRTLQADNVPVVVQADNKGLFGDGVDGLLGMSFLSRFNVAIGGKNVRIKTRKAR